MKNCLYNKIVIKVGTSTLVYGNGKPNYGSIEKLVRVISDLRNSGKDVVLVSSGAIGIGAGRLKVSRNKNLKIKQALAAIGQGILMQIYEKIFAEYCIIVAQVLVTRDDLLKGERQQNAFNTLTTLLDFGVVPIINENDTVATEEIVFGDNDTLAAVVSKLIGADHLIILSDVDGFYTAPPEEPGAEKISVIEKITPDIEMLAGGSGSSFGTGGMQSKIIAAKIATEAGIAMTIIDGENPLHVYDVLQGKNPGTLFIPVKEKQEVEFNVNN
ncbi:MAG TPA: glutamate 5-kinase [Thermoanaerobacterales bacterium]|nr:glutamate 5-kinase [Thermoanaerobacterales bacterium]